MRDKLLLIVSSLLLLSLSRGGAQESSDPGTPPPSPPFINPQPDYSTWTMTVTPLKSSPPIPSPAAATGPAPLELKQRQVTQTGKIQQEINRWSDGSTSQNWIMGNKRLVEEPLKHFIVVIDPDRDETAGFYTREDFLDIKWLSLDTFVHIESYQNHLCYYFQKNIANGSPGGRPEDYADNDYQRAANRAPGQAWIDVKTKQMVAYNNGSNIYTFDYGPPPTAELVLPPAFAKVWQRFHDDLNPLKIPQAPTT